MASASSPCCSSAMLPSALAMSALLLVGAQKAASPAPRSPTAVAARVSRVATMTRAPPTVATAAWHLPLSSGGAGR